jgi:predicted DsbA family dithiol-disulfide isomerase
MKIDIWSDIMCPFCYIGKRKLECALKDFEHKDQVEIVWHSFQLDPNMTTQPGKSIQQYLAERKGQSIEWSLKVHAQVAQSASAEGLKYNFDKAVIANSFDAHRLIHLAQKRGMGGAAKEALLKAYFTDGKNISDHNTLMQIGIDLGLRVVEIGEVLNSNAYANEVKEDMEQANALGVNGVPFFVLDDKYAISGAQPAEVFLNGLRQAWSEAEKEPTAIDTIGDSCSPDGNCDTN